MKTELLKILQDLDRGSITKNEARKLLLKLSGVTDCVFIVCENDNYGRDLFLIATNTIEEAEKTKGRENTRNIYKHELL